MKIKRFLILVATIIFFTTFLNAADRIYVLPKQATSAKEKIEELMKNAQTSIDVAMYSFDLKKFTKNLIDANERGVKVTVILDGSKTTSKKSAYYDLKKAGINVVIVDENKMHLKLAIFDKEEVVFGSANWKRESFKDNYELIYFTDDRSVVKKLNKFIEKIREEN